MLNKLNCALIASSLIVLFLCSYSFAQSDDAGLLTEKNAKCTFNGNVPFHSIKIVDGSLTANSQTGTAEILIKSELDVGKNTLNADIVAVIESISGSVSLLSGQEVKLHSKQFEFLISKTRKNNGKTIEITNKTPEGGRTDVVGSILVTNFDRLNNKASFILKMIFGNTFKITQQLGQDIGTDANGKVTAICRFKNAPVTFTGIPST